MTPFCPVSALSIDPGCSVAFPPLGPPSLALCQPSGPGSVLAPVAHSRSQAKSQFEGDLNLIRIPGQVKPLPTLITPLLLSSNLGGQVPQTRRRDIKNNNNNNHIANPNSSNHPTGLVSHPLRTRSADIQGVHGRRSNVRVGRGARRGDAIKIKKPEGNEFGLQSVRPPFATILKAN